MRSSGVAILVWALTGCASEPPPAASTTRPSGIVIDIFKGLPAEELERYEGQTVTVRGYLAQGNFAMALGPRRTIHRSDMWVSLHARKDNAAGQDALHWVYREVGVHHFMEATGMLRCHKPSRDGALLPEPDRDVWPMESRAGWSPLFWIELAGVDTDQTQR